MMGRYYKQNDAEFISGQIDLAKETGSGRLTVVPNPISDPYGHPRQVTDPQIQAQLDQTRQPKVKLLGLTWTGYTHNIRNYGELDNPMLSPQLEVSIEIRKSDGSWAQVAGPFLNADAGWVPLFVKLGRNYPYIRYRVRFNTRGSPENAVLLETPVLDDVTIYYTTRPQFLSWVESY
jgi:hypothetical protein